MLTRLSVKSKVVLILVAISLLSALIVGILSWRSSRTTLSQIVFANMTAQRRNKAESMEAYFRNMRYTVEVLSENDMVVEAMVRFNRAFRQLENSTISVEWDAALEAYYINHFFPRLFVNLPGQPDYDLYRPQNQAGLYLQYQYIVANRFDEGQKLLLDSAEDGSEYSKVHAYYHPRLRTLIQKLGFDDLILVNFETGDVVYNVSKQTDFAGNLAVGPYRRSNEAIALELVRNNTERGVAQLVDFELYRPGYGLPAAFWTAPLYNGNHLVGVLMAQISLETINQIMTANQQWAQVGLGMTGESYLVGTDRLMRSDARPRIEDPAAYQAALTERGVSQRTVELIKNFGTTVLLQEVDSPEVTAALQNAAEETFTTNYVGQAVLSSYQPLVLDGVQWALFVEMNADEVFAPIYAFQRQLLISITLMIVTLAFLAIGIAYLLTKPLNLLIESTRTAGDGTNLVYPSEFNLSIHSRDEWGELATTFTGMAHVISRQGATLKAKDQEIEQLLRNFLPLAAVQRVHSGETQIIDHAPQVTICALRIGGISVAAQRKSTQEVAAILQEIMEDIEEVAMRYDVEQLLSPGQQALAICGLSTPYLDHSRRMADFALALRDTVQLINKQYSIQLTLHSGLHSGPVSGSVVRTPKIGYELWGESVTVARQLALDAGSDPILVSQSVYDRLQEQYLFQRPRPDTPTGNRRAPGQATTWALVGAKHEGGA
ncbi:MAG: adenylate/guanylate cyclase domain-containing protein [Caldilineaceae bacterium]